MKGGGGKGVGLLMWAQVEKGHPLQKEAPLRAPIRGHEGKDLEHLPV